MAHWFVEKVSSIYLICKWLLYCQALSPDMQIIILLSIMEELAFFLQVLQTDRPTLFLKSARHTDSNGI